MYRNHQKSQKGLYNNRHYLPNCAFSIIHIDTILWTKYLTLHKLDLTFCWISHYCLTLPYIVLNSLTISSLCAAVLFPSTLVTAASLVPRPFIAFLSWSASVSALKPLNGFNVPSYYKHRTGTENHFYIYYLCVPVPDLITPIFFAIITHLCQDHKLVAKYIDEFLLNSNAFC